jgi:hypothetical protein
VSNSPPKTIHSRKLEKYQFSVFETANKGKLR